MALGCGFPWMVLERQNLENTIWLMNLTSDRPLFFLQPSVFLPLPSRTHGACKYLECLQLPSSAKQSRILLNLIWSIPFFWHGCFIPPGYRSVFVYIFFFQIIFTHFYLLSPPHAATGFQASVHWMEMNAWLDFYKCTKEKAVCESMTLSSVF